MSIERCSVPVLKTIFLTLVSYFRKSYQVTVYQDNILLLMSRSLYHKIHRKILQQFCKLNQQFPRCIYFITTNCHCLFFTSFEMPLIFLLSLSQFFLLEDPIQLYNYQFPMTKPQFHELLKSLQGFCFKMLYLIKILITLFLDMCNIAFHVSFNQVFQQVCFLLENKSDFHDTIS